MAAASVQGANNRVRVGVIGTGGRARGLMNQLKTDRRRRDRRRLRRLSSRGCSRPPRSPARPRSRSADYRRILDNREIDAVLIGTPDHWHKTMTLDAVAAGKDVYVEKPVSHTIEEGAEMVRVIEASKQIVQTGTQQRSWEHWILGKQIIDSGKLGQITFVHDLLVSARARRARTRRVALDKLDWKQWLGPAPDQPFRPERFYQWRHFWDFGGGCLTDLMTHWIDVVHWYMNVEAPLSAVQLGHELQHQDVGGARHGVDDARVPEQLHVRVSRHLRQPRRRRRAGVPRRARDAEDRPRAPGVLQATTRRTRRAR